MLRGQRRILEGALLIVVLALVLLAGCHSGGDKRHVGTFAAFAGVDAAQSQLRGDMDGDGRPGVGDAIAILRIVVGLDENVPQADADGDGATTVSDAILVLRCVVGLTDWPLGNLCGMDQIDLTAALNAPLPTSPRASAAAIQEALQTYLDDDNSVPSDRAELASELAAWVGRVTEDPDDVGAQVGLALAILAAAGHNGADSMCYNIFEELGLQEIADVATREDTSPAAAMTQTMQTMLARGTPEVPVIGSGGVRTEAVTVGELEDYRAAITTHLLGPIANAVGRFDACASGAVGLLLELAEDDESLSIYSADLRMVSAGLRIVRSLLLMASAFNPDYGNWDWDLDLEERDANGDGVLAVAEYAPGAPFAAIDATNWAAAGEWLRAAVADIQAALATRVADPDSLIGRLVEDPDEFADYAADAADILGGQVNMTFNYTELTSATVRTQATDTIPVNLRRLWDNPPANIQSMLPPLYLMVEEGNWTIPGAGEFSLWYEERIDDDTASYSWWSQPSQGQGLGGYVDVAIGPAPHQVNIAAQGSFPGAQLSFAAGWTTFTGTVGAFSVTGTQTAGRNLWLLVTPRWGDLPDQTMRGVFPDPAKIGDALFRKYDDWTLTYGSIQVGPGAE